ncbi:hypothetical protein [Halomicrococcus sp. NG-SE-24]|uniref:hypothetical protein n=1 Tax=Halomicrococcus sp. NG-SE-24 TaxID=3436928 RepID=UPI003D95C892
MSSVSAREALRYATDDEMLKLYAVLVGGWVLLLVGQFAFRTAVNPAVAFVGFVVALAAVVAVVSGGVAVAYKVLSGS